MQTIYYPGFTFGGFSEWLGIATAVLLWVTPRGSETPVWMLIALVCLIAMHAVYVVVTHPANKVWLSGIDLSRLGDGFFRVGGSGKSPRLPESDDEQLWTHLRDRWGYSHVLRAVLAALALIAMLVAIAI